MRRRPSASARKRRVARAVDKRRGTMAIERKTSFLGKTATFVVVAWCALLAACVGGSKSGVTSEDKERLKQYVLDQPPADMPHKLDVNFENKLHLIGYKFEP